MSKNLTNRESEIYELVKSGYDTMEIAAMLNISHRTVGVHRSNIIRKLNMRGTNLRFAIARISPP